MAKREGTFFPFPGVRHHQVQQLADEDKRARKKSTQILRVTQKRRKNQQEAYFLPSGKINTGSTEGDEAEYKINAHNFAPKDKDWKVAKKCKICNQVFTKEDPPYYCRNNGCSYRAHAFCLIFPDKIPQCQKAKQKATRSQSVGVDSTNSESTTNLFNTLAAQIAQRPKTTIVGREVDNDFKQQGIFIIFFLRKKILIIFQFGLKKKKKERNEQIQVSSECAFSLMLGIREVLQVAIFLKILFYFFPFFF